MAFLIIIVAAQAQSPCPVPSPGQVDLGDVTGAVVTLYYYDPVTDEKGSLVPVPENPQLVQWDYARAAPGTYVFYHVPQGTYYVEAVHDNHSWFAIVTVDQGTSTANVAIPLFNETSPAATSLPSSLPSSSVFPSPAATAIPSHSPSAAPSGTIPSPGMTTLSALAGLTLVTLYVVYRKE